MEWSYKKAITIQNYCTYDPIPVPFNLISNFVTVMKYICRTCWTNQQSTNEERVSDGYLHFTFLVRLTILWRSLLKLGLHFIFYFFLFL